MRRMNIKCTNILLISSAQLQLFWFTCTLLLLLFDISTSAINNNNNNIVGTTNGNLSKLNTSTSPTATNVHIELESINGTLNYRIYGKNDDKPWFDGRGLDMRHIKCVRHSRCERLTFNTCLGAKIPYEYTSLDLTDYHNQHKVLDRLNNYRALQHVPKCWAVIQPFLCAVFAPKCEQINGGDMVYLPSLEMCRLTLEPCRIIYNTTYFPDFLRCNETLFPPKCNNDVREMKFNVTGRCIKPLVPTDTSASFFPGIEGCGVQCKDPLYTEDEHRQIHKLVAYGGTICFLASLYVVTTFLIDWDNANKYPAVIVFYINLCLLIACSGWLAQFTLGSREDIVCRKDGTLRHSEPTAGENLLCVVVFVLVYYFLLAAMVWFVILTYAWYLRAVGNVQDRIDKKGSYFHLVAWSLPLVLTITTLALSEVDGNSTVGICFVGYLNHPIRAALLLGPLCGVIIVGGYFISRGMVMLFRLKHFANDIKSTSASNKIHLIIVRMGLCAILTVIFIFATIACHIWEFRHSAEWVESFKKFIICSISATFTDEHTVCRIDNRPSVAVLQLNLLCLFGSGIVMSTWCWTPSSIETWQRYIRKKCGKEIIEEVKMPKHKVIAQTWAKRKEFEDKGRLSITLYNTHTDPVGLNFDVNDLNSSETNEISSTWANYLPQFVKRRMALTGAGANNSSSQGPRKNSLDSEISFSVRHVSVESRRNSVDSQVSVKIAEMKTKVAARTRAGNHHHYHPHQHHHHGSKHGSSTGVGNKRSQRRRDFIAAATGRKFSDYSGRRESSTSIESQVIALKKTTYPNASHKVGVFATQCTKKHHQAQHNGKRRSANAGLDPSYINEFLMKNDITFDFLQNQGMSTSSDEETSHASLKIQDSRVDVVLTKGLNDNIDDDDYDDIDEADNEARCMDNDTKHAKTQAALENLLKNMQKSNESTNRNSRNSTRSRHSRKSQSNAHHGLNISGRRSMQRKNCNINSTSSNNKKLINNNSNNAKQKSNNSKRAKNEIFPSDTDLRFPHENDLDSNASCSSAELDIPLGIMLHSSYSGVSTGKPNSRNSKTSCDVGIQANAYEIATQTFASQYDAKDQDETKDEDEKEKEKEVKKTMRQLNAKYRRKSEYIEDEKEATELQTLLNGSSIGSNVGGGGGGGGGGGSNKHREAIIMSESERLKMLLLPSK